MRKWSKMRSRWDLWGYQVQFVVQKCAFFIFPMDILARWQLQAEPSPTVFFFSNLLQTDSHVIVISICANSLKDLITWGTEVVINDALMVPCLGLYKLTPAPLSSFLLLLWAALHHSIILTCPARVHHIQCFKMYLVQSDHRDLCLPSRLTLMTDAMSSY